MADESLADRLNRLARSKQQEQEVETRVRRTQEQVNEFILANARPAFDELLNTIARRVDEVNLSLQDLPVFEWRKNGSYVKQGNVAAFLTFHQLFANAGPITFHIAFGREPEGVYAEGFLIPGFGDPPEPERYELQPAMEQNPDRIVWTGDLGEMSSEALVDFTLTHLTEYYLNHKRT